MEIKRTQKEELTSLISVKVGEADYGEAVEKSLREYRRKANIPGFRPGMVPMGIIRKMYGKGVVAEQSYRTASNAVFEYLQKEHIDYLGDVIPAEEQGAFDFDNATEFEYMFEIGEAPKVELSFSAKDKLTYYRIKIDKKMHDSYRSNFLRRYGRLVDVEKVADDEALTVTLDNGELRVEEAYVGLISMSGEERKPFKGKKVGAKMAVNINELYKNPAQRAAALQLKENELETVRRQRDVQRKGRIRREIPLAAIVGYTNAGKSSLLNTLTGSEALVEDKLFATLDPTTRKLQLPNKSELLLTDTVGFVRKLPHSLIEAFKSTLEEAVLADFLILVLDCSSADVESHWQTTLSVLGELGAQEKPILTVFNKSDRQKDGLIRTHLRALAPDGVFISCRTGEGLDTLRETLTAFLKKRTRIDDLQIPPDRPDVVAAVYSRASLLEGEYLDDGSFRCTVRIPCAQSDFFAPFSRSMIEHKMEEYR